MRREGRGWAQTLKAPAASAVERIEDEVHLPGRASAVPLPDLCRHAQTAAAELVDAVLREGSEPVLVERFRTDVTRLLCVVEVEGTAIEVALDSGRVGAGEHEQRIEELEPERKAGPLQALFDLAAEWVAHGGLWLSTINKAQRGERLLPGGARVHATRAREAGWPSNAGAPTILCTLLHSVLDQVLGNASEVAEGSTGCRHDPPLRVGLRRLRTVLRELGSWSPRIRPEWEATLASAFAALGQLRDRESPGSCRRPGASRSAGRRTACGSRATATGPRSPGCSGARSSGWPAPAPAGRRRGCWSCSR